MDNDRTLDLFRILKQPDHLIDVCSIHRSEVLDAEILQQCAARHQNRFKIVLCPPDALDCPVSRKRKLPQGILRGFLEIGVPLTRPQIRQIRAQAANIPGDGHPIVIEDDDEVGLQVGSIVDRLVNHAARRGPISDDRYDRIFFTCQIPRTDNPESRGDRGGAVSGVKHVAAALRPLRKPGHAAQLSQRGEPLLASGQNFVRVGLMTHIPDQAVLRRIKREVKCHCQLHHAKVRSQVSARHGQLLDQKLPDLLCQLRELIMRNLPDITWLIDLLQYHRLTSCGSSERREALSGTVSPPLGHQTV